MRFTKRIGLQPSEKLVQRESIDDDLKNSMWSVMSIFYWDRVEYKQSKWGETKGSNLASLVVSIWFHFFKQPIDDIPEYFSDVLRVLRSWYFKADWGETYDFVEFVAQCGPEVRENDFIKAVNNILETENSAYRFVAGELTELTSKEEVESVEAAAANPYGAVREHLKSALSLMNDKENPDFRNSIKESISAVESLAKILSGSDKATLGQALKVLEKNGELHQALKSAFSSLYGYTNDANGIRHALLDEPSVTKSDAKFMLVSCSAFINYLTEISSSKA